MFICMAPLIQPGYQAIPIRFCPLTVRGCFASEKVQHNDVTNTSSNEHSKAKNMNYRFQI